jgi:hypothetical protein
MESCELDGAGIGSVSVSGSGIGSGIGIGSWWGGGIISRIGSLTILNGNIPAIDGSNGADIGNGYSTLVKLAIMNGNITANSSFGGGGIGIGGGTSTVVNLMILNGNITAIRLSYGVGIGSESVYLNGTSTVDTLSIQGGRIPANGSQAAIRWSGDGSEFRLLIFTRNGILLCDVTNASTCTVNASSIVLDNAINIREVIDVR